MEGPHVGAQAHSQHQPSDMSVKISPHDSSPYLSNPHSEQVFHGTEKNNPAVSSLNSYKIHERNIIAVLCH